MKVALLFEGDGNGGYQRPLWERGVAAADGTLVPADGDEAEIYVAWGAIPAAKALIERGKTVLILDFPWWNRPQRKVPHALNDAYKISLNGQHPTQYVMRERHPPARYVTSGGPPIHPWRKGGKYVLLLGMGPKTERAQGFRRRQWETKASALLRRHCDLPIIYRPKASDKRPRPIAGIGYDKGQVSIEQMIMRAHAVVTFHSHYACVALALGIPVFAQQGVAAEMGMRDLSEILTPVYPENREQFFWNLAHWQWTGREIAAGAPLRSLRERKLI